MQKLRPRRPRLLAPIAVIASGSVADALPHRATATLPLDGQRGTVRYSLRAVMNLGVNEGVVSEGPPRAGELWVGLNLFRLLRRSIAFTLTRIALVVLTFARRILTYVLCLVTFAISGVLASVLGLLARVPSLSFVLEVAVWAERQA